MTNTPHLTFPSIHTTESTLETPDANPRKFHPRGSDETLAYRGSLSTSFSAESTDVEQDMANAVKTEMQLYSGRPSGNRGRCLEQAYNYLMSVPATSNVHYSPRQMFCALTCALCSLTTLLILYAFCIQTATNVDSVLTVLTALTISLFSLRRLQLFIQVDIELSLLSML